MVSRIDFLKFLVSWPPLIFLPFLGFKEEATCGLNHRYIYEYQMVGALKTDDLVVILNNLGMDRWELVEMIPNGQTIELYLKRYVAITK